MSFDLEKIFASKRALRRDLAARPLVEKLRMLDALRERELAIRHSRSPNNDALKENPPAYPAGSKDNTGKR
jgi:hypothetical protein